ncbi:MAG TPA: VTT domain-containing protein [Gemmatimonadaceae bacterium]|jgi:membrane protein DedA with SNARE-associated domain|nr:VTT domain-containing protein [Gemmatimonadaceae bacterium]
MRILSLLLQSLTHLSDSSTHLERLWAYITLGVSGIFTEETSPLIGGLAAHNRHLQFTMVVLAVGLGTWLADILLYYLGRWRGRWVRRRWPRLRGVILRALRVVRRHPWRSSLAVRFAYGLRFTLPIACGAARVPIVLYAIGSGISAALWSLTFTFVGWGFGRTTKVLVGHPRRYELYVGAAVILLALLAFVVARRRHVEERTVEVLDTD